MNRIDHIVINTRDQTDEALAFFNRMGFIVTARGYHTLGSINHTVVFQHDYLELLGYPPGKPPEKRPELVARPAGLMATVLNADDADRVRAELQKRGLAPRPVSDFSRPVDLGHGQSGDAAFRVTRLEPDAIPGSWFYYCQQVTPQFVWRPEWQAHANSVTSMTRLTIQVDDPAAAALLYLRAIEGAQASEGSAGARVIRMQDFEIELIAGTPGMRKLVFGVASLERCAAALAAGSVAHRMHEQRIIVDAQAQLGCMLEFEAA
ncbi:MAG TPA: VOC family protein [Burkholderiales bacterium]|jgi:catechol 2,3-dioxygenase-like lactoylglutathione lyase family enzyme